MVLKPYNKLGTTHRNEPCIEYPGEWIVYSAGEEHSSHPNYDAAYVAAYQEALEYDKRDQHVPINISICWKASDNDPRIGEVWFTSFYEHGKFNQFGSYKS